MCAPIFGRSLLERSPEKAGVGGSTPSLATMFSITYEDFLKFRHSGGRPLSWADGATSFSDPFCFQ